MHYFFYVSLFLYWFSYLLPFAYDLLGYQIDVALWAAIFDYRPTLSGFTIVWSLRCLVNALILAICWMRLPPVHRWLLHHVDVDFLYQLLCAFAVVLLFYAFAMTRVQWNWGGFLWAFATLLTVLSYRWRSKEVVPEVSLEQGLERHLVPLEEEHP